MRELKFKGSESICPVNVKVDAACERYSRGRASMMADAKEAGALIRIGRSVLINVPRMDQYYEHLAGV